MSFLLLSLYEKFYHDCWNAQHFLGFFFLKKNELNVKNYWFWYEVSLKSYKSKAMLTSYRIGFYSVWQNDTVWYEHTFHSTFILSVNLKTWTFTLMCFDRKNNYLKKIQEKYYNSNIKNGQRIKNRFLLERWWNTVCSFIG